ncbi:purple acid phosphatase 22-like [Chenopodium quinoa]|uniref:purple acid phosphatase 22-like n=1 Tax=Chenopodium quinoa TaxID=63459 RepID=UPI000B771D43|nr:purple acid phosphatase 22-like [Chenopodium quinoa]
MRKVTFLLMIFLPQLLFQLQALASDNGCVATTSTSSPCNSQPQQVHISLAGNGYMRISWITTYKMATSVVEFGTKSGSYNEYILGDNFSYHYYSYVSGKIHYVTIGPLTPSTTYYYRVGGTGPEYSFRTAPAAFPAEFVLVGGVGQTQWTKATLDRISQRCYDALVVAGGLSYADGHQSLWDSFGRLIEPYASQKPWMVASSKYEIEGVCTISKGPQPFKAFNARWLMPYHESGSSSNLYYSFDVAGAHFIMLGSYADFDASSAQYEWLKADLINIDRAKTPWVIVVVNTPWYTSNVAYKGEGESMRKAMESLLYTFRVDVVFASRVNAYERFARVYDNKPDACAPVYITLGDAGFKPNFEFEQSAPSTSLHRELTFGHGRLRIYDSKKAHFAWYRTEDDSDYGNPSDEVWLKSLMSSENCVENCACKKFSCVKTEL